MRCDVVIWLGNEENESSKTFDLIRTCRTPIGLIKTEYWEVLLVEIHLFLARVRGER